MLITPLKTVVIALKEKHFYSTVCHLQRLVMMRWEAGTYFANITIALQKQTILARDGEIKNCENCGWTSTIVRSTNSLLSVLQELNFSFLNTQFSSFSLQRAIIVIITCYVCATSQFKLQEQRSSRNRFQLNCLAEKFDEILEERKVFANLVLLSFKLENIFKWQFDKSLMFKFKRRFN